MPIDLEEVEKVIAEAELATATPEATMAAHGSALQVDDLMELCEGDMLQPLYHDLKDAERLKSQTGEGWRLISFARKAKGKKEAVKGLVRLLNDVYPMLDIRGVLAIGGLQLMAAGLEAPDYVAFAMLGLETESAAKVEKMGFNPDTLEGVQDA